MERSAAEQTNQGRPVAFADILCAVDGSRDAREAARQAIALCAPGASLTFLAVCHSVGVELAVQAELGEERANGALEEAAHLARQAGIRASTELRSGAPASDLLLEEAAGHDLLVLGSRGGSRLGGILLGSTTTQIAHRAERPLLVARHSPDGGEFPRRILLATDGSPGSWAAARAATALAKAQRSELRLAHVPDGTHPERRREVLKQIAMIEKTTAAPPEVMDDPGHAAERICEAAGATQSSLVVIGHRGVSGIKALGSVSERVVHRAPCSVLVVPLGPDGD
jgi:nucleotide-binding universal stress UspA family protein